MTSSIAYLNSFSIYTDVYTHRYNQIYYIILDCVSLIGRLFGLLHTAQGLKGGKGVFGAKDEGFIINLA